ncbi:MAG TPA: relaxase/mobilization nuclease domain-containing protein [Xanthobacteraceae bacterium]|nr:relaxase/mobilization nuclease domain-containing protein [Xanthobacteraceae bacterium]
MIVKIHGSGKSFKGAANYLAHDPQAQTSERVAWTHTLNCANDFVPSAVGEMVWTARDAELLKQEAGVRAGGRQTENPVKTLSLNWSPEDSPSQEHMIATTQAFLRHMKWHEHQAILIAHSDKPYKHVHVLLNTVHAETGLHLDEGFEKRRAQAWALNYEREQGRIYCEERLKDAAERERSAPRNVWQAFQQNEQEFMRAEKSLAENQPIPSDFPENRENAEWRILKEIQSAERMEFFASGKIEFSELRKSIYREVREEFRERWSDYYQSKRDGLAADDLARMKEGIVADQKAVLEVRREASCAALRHARDDRYRELLSDHREARADLHWRQELGVDNADFLSELAHRNSNSELSDAFQATAVEVTRDSARDSAQVPGAPSFTTAREDSAPEREHIQEDVDFTGVPKFEGLVAGFIGGLFEELINLGSPRQPRRPERDASGRDPFKAAAEETLRQEEHRQREEEDLDRQRRQRVPHGD